MIRHGARLGSAGGVGAVIEVEQLSAGIDCVTSPTCSIFVCNCDDQLMFGHRAETGRGALPSPGALTNGASSLHLTSLTR